MLVYDELKLLASFASYIHSLYYFHEFEIK